ncbi:hypothetical protein CDAR_93981 [Caerostris darwini]|uniref:Uncharacterized protein n=1 Tax=Caerostris darwini TaxID=1538125 RepID=A0AAV4NMY8_9ARAC|nr:hypothetical protein CDAR_93981 [Caerostris darwini]
MGDFLELESRIADGSENHNNVFPPTHNKPRYWGNPYNIVLQTTLLSIPKIVTELPSSHHRCSAISKCTKEGILNWIAEAPQYKIPSRTTATPPQIRSHS